MPFLTHLYRQANLSGLFESRYCFDATPEGAPPESQKAAPAATSDHNKSEIIKLDIEALAQKFHNPKLQLAFQDTPLAGKAQELGTALDQQARTEAMKLHSQYADQVASAVDNASPVAKAAARIGLTQKLELRLGERLTAAPAAAPVLADVAKEAPPADQTGHTDLAIAMMGNAEIKSILTAQLGVTDAGGLAGQTEILDPVLKIMSAERLALLKNDPAHFELSPNEREAMKAGVVQAAHLERVGTVDQNEIALLRGLKTADGKTLEELFGKQPADKETLAGLLTNLSRGHDIVKTDKGITFDGKPVATLDDLRKALPDSASQDKTISLKDQLYNLTTKKDAELQAAREALNGIVKTDGEALDKSQAGLAQIDSVLKSPERSAEVFGKDWKSSIQTILQLIAAVKAAFASNPPDFTVVTDIGADMKAQRNPAETMQANRGRFDSIIKTARPQDTSALLEAYVDPRGKAADGLFNETNARKAGIIKPDDIAALTRYRQTAQTAILAYMSSELGITVNKIEKSADSSVITLTGYKGSEKVELAFGGTGENMRANLYGFGIRQTLDTDGQVQEQSVRSQDARMLDGINDLAKFKDEIAQAEILHPDLKNISPAVAPAVAATPAPTVVATADKPNPSRK